MVLNPKVRLDFKEACIHWNTLERLQQHIALVPVGGASMCSFYREERDAVEI